MKKHLSNLLLFFIFFYTSVALASTPDLMNQSNQLLRVTTTDWSTLKGTLQRYQRIHQQWQPIGNPIPVVIGKNGLGWGVAFIAPAEGPVKIEGDGKSPAGIFEIGKVFGFAAQYTGIKMQYLPITNSTFCVDDHNSTDYNQIINAPHAGISGEQMAVVSLYKWGAIVEYNTHYPIANRGSCIFMHIWRNPDSGTAGCVAMDESNLTQILSWLNPAEKPVIALLPQEEYNKLRKEWGLPL